MQTSRSLEGNQFTLKRIMALVKSLQLEKDYGCRYSPYAEVLLNNLAELVQEQININIGTTQ